MRSVYFLAVLFIFLNNDDLPGVRPQSIASSLPILDAPNVSQDAIQRYR